MMLVYETPDGTTGQIVFDDFLESDHGGPVDITKHPISSKAVITDHVNPGLEELKVVAVASNDAIAPHQRRDGQLTRGGLQVEPVASNGTTRTEQVFQTLEEIKRNAYLCMVFTTLRVYNNMLIKDLRTKVSKHGINALDFNIDFEEIRISRVQTVPAPAPRFIRTRGRSNKGGNATERASEETQKDVVDQINQGGGNADVSILERGRRFFGG